MKPTWRIWKKRNPKKEPPEFHLVEAQKRSERQESLVSQKIARYRYRSPSQEWILQPLCHSVTPPSIQYFARMSKACQNKWRKSLNVPTSETTPSPKRHAKREREGRILSRVRKNKEGCWRGRRRELSIALNRVLKKDGRERSLKSPNEIKASERRNLANHTRKCRDEWCSAQNRRIWNPGYGL